MNDAKPRWDAPVLVVVGGLPATGKSMVARTIARKLNAAYLRIDTIDHAVMGFTDDEAEAGPLRHAVTWGLSYGVAYAVAGDLLAGGLHVFAECVNPMKVTRDAWYGAAAAADAQCVEVELVCSDAIEHERRIVSRTVDLPGLTLPTWQEVLEREYEPWEREHLVVDTSGKSLEDTITELCDAMGLARAWEPSGEPNA